MTWVRLLSAIAAAGAGIAALVIVVILMRDALA